MKEKELSIYSHEIIDRHQGIITAHEQEKLSNAVICGAGAGGVGGWTYLALARLGCLKFRIADPGQFDASNVNRQAGCSIETIGRNKASVIAKHIHKINPNAQVSIFEEGLTHKNLSSFLQDGSIIIDGIDLYELEIKKALFDNARNAGIPIVSCPILGFGAALAFFHPTKSPTFDQYFGAIPLKTDNIAYHKYIRMFGLQYFGFKPKLDWSLFTQRVEQGKVPSLGISCMLSASITVAATIDYLLQKGQFPIVPTTLHIDLMQHRIVKIGSLKRLILKLYVNLYLWYLNKNKR
jgi:molybdopterin/thiamine biosynthesis adenylyltransferase